MNAVIGTASLLSGTRLDPEQREFVETIQRSGDLLVRLLGDILDLSRIEAGRMVVERVAFDPGALLREIVELVRPRAVEKGLALDLDLDPALPARLGGDPVRLRQVLLNLVGNAVKFTAAGRVVVSVRREQDSARFTIADTGIGIAPDVLGGLFRPFTQADASTTRRFGGSGLGLSISKGLVERMGGTIGADSTPGQGSTFWFTLPLLEPATPAAPAPAATPVTVRALRVLLAEDNPVNQRMAERMLQRLGHTVQVAPDGAAAVAAVLDGPFDLVLMDCQMPVLDGYEATRAIRDLTGERGRVPVIALTANALSGDREKCLDAGMDDYLPKPFRIEELAAMLARWAAVRL